MSPPRNHQTGDEAAPDPTRAAPDPTRAVYEARAGEWRELRRPGPSAEVRHLIGRLAGSAGAATVVDLGCGPGWYAAQLANAAHNVIGIDNARAMLELARVEAPHARFAQADLHHLPFRTGSVGGAVASKSYVHLPRSSVPLALHDLHRCVALDAPVYLHLFPGDHEHHQFPDDDFPGRRFSGWPVPLLQAVLLGAGFTIDDLVHRAPPSGNGGVGGLHVQLRRARTLADTVGPGMRLLVVGLNPSLYAADAGVGFARPGNRFWPAALAAGLVTRPRDPRHALAHHGLGMTDVVKRATARADELTAAEYRAGVDRLDLLSHWLQPQALCFVGLAGWRAAVDRKAMAGAQSRTIGGRPVYVMPSTSGLNAHSSLASLTDHLREAASVD